MSSQLVWQIVKNNNSFIRKGINGTLFSAEPGNLYNKNSYKYSGLANTNAIGVSAGSDDAVTLSVGRPKAGQKPKSASNKQVVKKNARRALVSAAKQAGSFRADLKSAAQARMAAIQKSLRVKKAKK